MRIRSLVASSSALIAAIIFAVAPSAAASARENAAQENAALAAYAVNAGMFESWTVTIIAEPASLGTPENGLCNGNWSDNVASVPFQRTRTGALSWGFLLTKLARHKLGRVVRVTMPLATVNNRRIDPPYSPHTESSGYNFQSSLHYYQFLGSRTKHVIETGNKILLYWVIIGSSGDGAYRYIRCTIP